MIVSLDLLKSLSIYLALAFIFYHLCIKPFVILVGLIRSTFDKIKYNKSILNGYKRSINNRLKTDFGRRSMSDKIRKKFW